jgi:hypothetical protein
LGRKRPCEPSYDCYIEVSGSTSYISFPLPLKLQNNRNVCVRLDSAHLANGTKKKEAGKHSWRRYLIAAPMLWLE